MKHIAVTDTCIFIDLRKYELMDYFFQLPFQMHTSYGVWGELDEELTSVLEKYRSQGKLTIHSLTSEQRKEMNAMKWSKGLSPQDKSVIYLATQLEAMLLSSDALVRKTAKNFIEVHGLIWSVEQFVAYAICEGSQGIILLERMEKGNPYFFNNEKLLQHCKQLKDKWKNGK